MSFSLEWERGYIQPSSHGKALNPFPVPTQWLDATEAIMFNIDCSIQAPHLKLEEITLPESDGWFYLNIQWNVANWPVSITKPKGVHNERLIYKHSHFWVHSPVTMGKIVSVPVISLTRIPKLLHYYCFVFINVINSNQHWYSFKDVWVHTGCFTHDEGLLSSFVLSCKRKTVNLKTCWAHLPGLKSTLIQHHSIW